MEDEVSESDEVGDLEESTGSSFRRECNDGGPWMGLPSASIILVPGALSGKPLPPQTVDHEIRLISCIVEVSLLDKGIADLQPWTAVVPPRHHVVMS